ncbi:MAG: response regulator transcription factor [Solirubrobacteraceae bacterium]
MRALVIEDDDAVCQAVRRSLLLSGYEVITAADGEQGLLALAETIPDVVVLDLGLPKLDGIEVCRRLRAIGDHTPVLMLTARDAVEDRVAGLEAGADDYLIKPYDVRELRARLAAIMRRHLPETEGRTLRFGALKLDADAHAARLGEREIELTRTEYQLLELFMLNPRRVLRTELVYERIWGHDISVTSNSLRVYIGYLRRKLEAGGEPRLLHTVHGVGYVLREQ